MACCLPPSLQGQHSSGTATQSLSVLQSAVEAGAFFAALDFLAWARKGAPNDAAPSAARMTNSLKRDLVELEDDMAGYIAFPVPLLNIRRPPSPHLTVGEATGANRQNHPVFAACRRSRSRTRRRCCSPTAASP